MSTKNFISVDGDDLQARLAAAQTQARTASRSRYWAAYKFPVRPNMSVDAVLMSSTGLSSELIGAITGNVGEHETRSLGVFLLYGEPEQEPLRVEIYNLERTRNYEGWPVYWLGEVESPESLKLLSSLVRLTKDEMVGGKIVEAIAVHESPQVAELLAELARSSQLVAVRSGAVFCLGRFGENLSLVEEVAGNASENVSVRQQAILAIGKSRSAGALEALRRLMGVVREHSLREAIVKAVAKSRQPGANELLESFVENSDDAVLKRRAQMQLLKASGKKKEWKQKRFA